MNRRRQGLTSLLIDDTEQFVNILTACFGGRYSRDPFAGAVEVSHNPTIIRNQKSVCDAGENDLKPKRVAPFRRTRFLAFRELPLILRHELAGALFAPSETAVIPALHLDDNGNNRAFTDEQEKPNQLISVHREKVPANRLIDGEPAEYSRN
jgi:hypothetical protein